MCLMSMTSMAYFLGIWEIPLPRTAIATLGAASAKAESSKNMFTAKAIVAPTKFGEAQATAQSLFIPHDPQGRAQVTLDLKLKMTATQASLDPINTQHAGAFRYAGYVSSCVGSVAGPDTCLRGPAPCRVGAPTADRLLRFGAETKGYAGGTWRGR